MAGGRPKFKIDYELVDKLSHIQCTQEEIAQILGCSVDTLQRDKQFCGIYKKGIDSGKSSLRRLQWASAEQGNSTMLVWLGKQYLGQRDKIDNDTTIDGNVKNVHYGNVGLVVKLEGELEEWSK